MSTALEFSSGKTQVPLIELYTSEGCSSCPPADKWLSQLKDHPQLWTRFIPIAFHVDYWNYLGWEDRFSNPANSQRQMQYRREGAIDSVYTPGFVLGGKEWRQWRFRKGSSFTIDAEKLPMPGSLDIKLEQNQLSASFKPHSLSTQGKLGLNIAILAFNQVSPVKSGENQGLQLHHDFVVLQHRLTLAQTEEKRKIGWSVKLTEDFDSLPGKKAIVAWVSSSRSIKPIQAAGAWLP